MAGIPPPPRSPMGQPQRMELGGLQHSASAPSLSSRSRSRRKASAMAGDPERIMKYHNALLKGRHPLSFPKKDTPFWQSVNKTNKRLGKVRSKQVLKTVLNGEYKLGDTVKKKGSLPDPKDNRPSTAMSSLSRYSKKSGDRGRAKTSHSRPGTTGMGLAATKGLAALKEDDQEKKKLLKRKKEFWSEAKKEHDHVSGNNVRRDDTEYTEADFNVIRGAKIFYGSMVAFEFSESSGRSLWLTVTHNGKITVAKRNSGQYVFTLMNMNHPADQGPVNYGDSVWMQVTSGVGDKWQNGSVIGSRMKQAVNLIEETRPDNASMGEACPVRAYIPGEKHGHRNDHLDRTATNRLPLVVGKWKLRPALRTEHEENQRRQKQLFNLSETYLEQDWFFMGSTKEGNVVLRKLLTSSQDAAAGKYMIPISGVWKMHLVEAQSTGSGTRSAERVEHLLYKARQQLHKSKDVRDGKKQYSKDLRGGSQFPVQIRRLIQSHDLVQESNFLHNQETCSQTHFSRGRSAKITAIQKQFEANMDSAGKRTNSSPKNIERNARKMVNSLKVMGPNLSVRDWKRMRERQLGGDEIAEVGTRKTTKGKNSLYRTRKPKGASEWYRRMCGVDLNVVDKEVNMDLQKERQLTEDEALQKLRQKALLEENYEENIAAIEKLPIFDRMTSEDDRMVQVLHHREANRAFIEFYSGMFADVEW